MSVIHEGDECLVRVECPHCSQVVDIETVLDGVLKVRAGKSTLSVACTAKTLTHLCGQGTIDEEPAPTLEEDVVEVVRGFVGHDLDYGLPLGTTGELRVNTDTGEIHGPTAERGVRL